jgi:hypothetical protein
VFGGKGVHGRTWRLGMNRTRHGVALSIVIALAAMAVVSLRPTEQAVVALPPPTTTTTTSVVTTTTVPATTTTTVLDRTAEVEEIVRDLYFRWFDGVYREDMATIDAIAGTTQVLGWAERAFGKLAFLSEPKRDEILVDVKNILLDRPDCLVVSVDVDYRTFFGVDEPHSTVDVYFRVGDGWGFAVKYKYEREMWQVDCDLMRRR